MLTEIFISLLISSILIFLYAWHFKTLLVKDVIIGLIPIINILSLLGIIWIIIATNTQLKNFLNKQLL